MYNDDVLISVIVPIYNVSDYLEQCIESIISQTYKALEIILVDDGSTDDSGKICDEYEKKDQRIKVIHKKNEGVNSARRIGIQNASGEFVGYVDGDDWIETEMYSTMMNLQQKYNADVVICGIKENYNGRERWRIPHLEERFYDRKTFKDFVEKKVLYNGEFYKSSVSTFLFDKLVRKDIIKKYQLRSGLDTSLSDDTMVAIPAVIEAGNVVVTHQCFLNYRIREDSIKHSVEQVNYGRYISKHYEDWKNTLDLASSGYDYESDLQKYLIYVLAMKSPGLFDVGTNQLLTLYGVIETGAKIFLYGAGQTGLNLMRYIKTNCNINVVAWTDRDYDKLPTAYNLCAHAEAVKKDYDYLIITAMRRDAYESICRDVEKLGVPREKIRWISGDVIEKADNYINNIIKNYRGE